MVEVVLRFVGGDGEENPPPTAVYGLDANGRVAKKLGSVTGDRVDIGASFERAGSTIIAIGPDTDDLSTISVQDLIQIRADELRTNEMPIEIPKTVWNRWIPARFCLSGRVEKCRFWLDPRVPSRLTPYRPPRPVGCTPICNGVVEIYERMCCRPARIIPDIPDIIERLKKLVDEQIRIPGKWPPPPPPWEVGVTFDQVGPWSMDLPETVSQDIKSLETLPRNEAIAYAQKRPYLWPYWCRCTTRKIGEAVLNPDGQFRFCYFPRVPISRRNCWTSYYYKVKQWHENQWTYLYDGSHGHQHFTASQYAVLRTPFGRACRQPPPITPPGEKPWVMLQEIGTTASWRLHSNWKGMKGGTYEDLTQLDDTSLAPLDPDGGLVDLGGQVPDVVVGDPSPWLVNQPWGGNLDLTLFISNSMKNAKAVYYRISVVPAAQAGTPVAGEAPRFLADPVSWLKFVVPGSGAPPQVVSESLGPFTVGDTVALFKIPFDDEDTKDREIWLAGQPHQTWYTSGFRHGRYLLSVEIFDKDGILLEKEKFLNLRWLKETGTSGEHIVAIVPHQRLVHLFWIDNRPSYANIVDLRKDGSPCTAECQYFKGPATTTFSAGFHAHHPPEENSTSLLPGTPDRSFLWYYTLWTWRGLNGTEKPLETSGVNTVFKESATPRVSATLDYATMLSGIPTQRCTFSLSLVARTKHTNGNARLTDYDTSDHAAFSVEIGADLMKPQPVVPRLPDQ